MWEFEIRRKDNHNEIHYIWGYDATDAFRRSPELNPDEWEITLEYYID